MKNIIVNASALRTGGALTILLQFLSEIPNDENTYFVFIHKSIIYTDHKSNTRLIRVEKTTFLERFIWDLYGINKWLELSNVKPDICISLQNTNFRVNANCPNYVYYHQPIPFYNYKWNVFKRNERNLWFYKNIYPFFVLLFINNKTEFFVQLNYIKNHFSKKYNVANERIHVVFPNIEVPVYNPEECEKLNSEKLNFFYPATSHSYKNHELIYKALKKVDLQINRKIVFYVTNNKTEFNFDYQFKNIEIVYLGKITFSKVNWYYNNVDCLLFPSYMETLGLPLIEAASCGLKVIASDLPYAREVLRGYEGVTFVKYDDVSKWSELLLTETFIEKTPKYTKFLMQERVSWKEFFKIIKQN